MWETFHAHAMDSPDVNASISSDDDLDLPGIERYVQVWVWLQYGNDIQGCSSSLPAR